MNMETSGNTGNTGNTVQHIHTLMNHVDALKDATHVSDDDKIKGTSLDNFSNLVKGIFIIPDYIKVKSYNEKYAILEDLVGKQVDFDDIQTLHICRLEYFQNTSKKLSLPTIPLTLLADVPTSYAGAQSISNTGVEYGVQDSGKVPQAFGENIKTVITPATHIDPASRKRIDAEQEIEYMGESMNVPAAVFKKFGMNYIKSFEVTSYKHSTYTFTVTTDIFGVSKSNILTVNTKTLKPDIINVFNYTILGNHTKNTWFNTNYNKQETAISTDNKRMAVNYILMKLLGDLLQVYYTRKLIKDVSIPLILGNTCVFTSDRVLAMRALLEGVPCLIEILGKAKKGCDEHIYQFKRKGEGKMTLEEINKHSANKIFQHNFEVHRRLMEVITGDFSNIYVNDKLVNINDSVKTYIIRMAKIVIHVINEIYMVMQGTSPADYLNLTIDADTFRQHINTYRASDIFNITGGKSKAMASKRMFPLLGVSHRYNSDVTARADGEDIIQYKLPNMAFNQFIVNNLTRNIGITRVYRRMNGGDRCILPPIIIDYEDLLNNVVPDIAVMAIIGLSCKKFKKHIINSEDIFTILFPYFNHVGGFSVNCDFYEWCITEIYRNYFNTNSEYLNIHEFTEKYNSIHDDTDNTIHIINVNSHSIKSLTRNNRTLKKSIVREKIQRNTIRQPHTYTHKRRRVHGSLSHVPNNNRQNVRITRYALG